MELVSQIVKIEADLPVDSNYIENKLSEMGFNPLRWAIVAVNDNVLTISLACECLC